jgi:lipoyl(octanoyl) transferase
MTIPCCSVLHLGLVDYQAARLIQEKLSAEVAAGVRPATLLLLEHPHTYTFGRRGHIENLLWDEAELARRGVAVHWVDRGGDVTYHGPGQLVGYPLLPLSPGGLQVSPTGGNARLPQADYVGYVRRLERMLIHALASFDLDGHQEDGLTGVWVHKAMGESPTIADQAPASQPELAKIAAIGVKVNARGVSLHGFALNVNPDMTYWQGIVGCGLVGYSVTSMAELLNPAPSMDAVTQVVINSFGKTFQFEMVEGSEGSASSV